MLIDPNLLNSMVPSNFCFKCTVLHEGGTEHERYTRTAFLLGPIAKHITNNKQNIVISELTILSGGLVLGLTGGAILAGHESAAYLPFMSQLSQHSAMTMTQPLYTQQLADGAGPMTQPSYTQHLADGGGPMGFGF
jgi:hypothetical protein